MNEILTFRFENEIVTIRKDTSPAILIVNKRGIEVIYRVNEDGSSTFETSSFWRFVRAAASGQQVLIRNIIRAGRVVSPPRFAWEILASHYLARQNKFNRVP